MSDRRTLPVLLLAVLSTFTAQQVLTPVLAPLAREIGFSEVALGSIITVAAIVFAGTALAWGRAVARHHTGTRSGGVMSIRSAITTKAYWAIR